jgi:transcriptional regulator with XRE-family HTH domain
MSIGSNIKSFRKGRKLTQNELALKANISRSYLADVEGDRYNPSLDTLEAIAKALGVSVSSILGEDPELESIDHKIVGLDNEILTTLKLLVNDEGYFYEDLREDIFKAITSNIFMSTAYHNSSDSDRYISRFDEYFNSIDDYTDRQHKEEIEEFNKAYDIRTIKRVLGDNSTERKEKFLNALKEIVKKIKLKNSPGPEEEFVRSVDLSDEELMKKYRVTVDGRELTEKEWKKLIAFLRIERDLD